MKYTESLSIDFFNSLSTCDFSSLNMAQLCEKKGIICFESKFTSDIYGYIYKNKNNNKTHIHINSNLPSNQKEITISSFLAMYILNINRENEKIYLNSSDFKIFNKYYKLGLNLFFNKKILDRTLNKEQIKTLKDMNGNIFKFNKLGEISKKANISLPHVFNYINY